MPIPLRPAAASRPRRAALSAPVAVATLLLAGATPLLSSCASGPESRIDPEKQLELYRLTALGHYELGDMNAAERQALKGLELDDDDRSLRLMLGWILLRRGDVKSLERAEWVFDRYIDDNGGEARAWLGLAAAHERLGVAYDLLADEIERGERLPDRGSPSKRAAEFREQARESWLEARKLYDRTLNDSTGSLRALDGEQRVAARLGEFDEALSWSAKLLETAQAESEWYQRALREREMEPREEQRTRASEREIRRLMVDTHLVASSIHVARGQLNDALAHLDQALELAPKYVEGFSRRAQLHYSLGNYDQAQADIRRFIGSSTLPTNAPDMQAAFALLDHAQRGDPGFDLGRTNEVLLPDPPEGPVPVSRPEGADLGT